MRIQHRDDLVCIFTVASSEKMHIGCSQAQLAKKIVQVRSLVNVDFVLYRVGVILYDEGLGIPDRRFFFQAMYESII